MDEQEAIYQKLCQFRHTAYEMSERGNVSEEIDETVAEVLKRAYDGEFQHDPNTCRECQIEQEIHDRVTE